MAMAMNIVRGITYPLLGAAAGLVAGVCGTVLYLSSRIALHIPNSVPNLDISINSQNISLSNILECLEQNKPNCLPPIQDSIDFSNWTTPLTRGGYIMAGVGFGVGLAFVGYKVYQDKQAKRGYIFLNSSTDSTNDERIPSKRSTPLSLNRSDEHIV